MATAVVSAARIALPQSAATPVPKPPVPKPPVPKPPVPPSEQDVATDMLLQRPTLVPCNTVIHLTSDPTLLQFEKVAAPRGPAPTVISNEHPLEFQCISVTVVEDPIGRATDVAAFRRGTFDAAHYIACGQSQERPKNGREFVPEVKPMGRSKAAETFVRLTGTTNCNRTITAFVAYDPWFYVQVPDQNLRDAKLRDILDNAPRKLDISSDDMHVTTESKFPLCGWQADPNTWLRVELPNQDAKRHLTKILEKCKFKVAMHNAPLTEELMAVMGADVRHCAHIRLLSGTIVPLDEQVEAVDIEVHRVDSVVCIHNSDDGEPPPATPRRSASWDLELADRARSGKFVDISQTENRVTMASVVVRQHGTIVPYDPRSVSARKAEEELESKDESMGRAEEKESKEAHPATVEGYDFDAVDDVVDKAKASKKVRLGGTHDFDVARIIVSIYELPPDPEHTVILVPNEIALFQTIRRICRRLRVSVRMGHNTDGFDSVCQRVKLMALTHRHGATCWFPDHDMAGGDVHRKVRQFIDPARKAAFQATLLREQMEKERQRFKRQRTGKAKSRDNEPATLSKERMGLWAPEEFTDIQLARVVAFNMSLLLDDLDMKGVVARVADVGKRVLQVANVAIVTGSDEKLGRVLQAQGFASGRHFEATCKQMVNMLSQRFVEPFIKNKGSAAPPCEVTLAIVGSRDFKGAALLAAEVEKLKPRFIITKIVSGGAKGADTLAQQFAEAHDIPFQAFLPTDPSDAKALLARNTQIVEAANVVLAFPTATSRGTWDTLRKAAHLPRTVVKVTPSESLVLPREAPFLKDPQAIAVQGSNVRVCIIGEENLEPDVRARTLNGEIKSLKDTGLDIRFLDMLYSKENQVLSECWTDTWGIKCDLVMLDRFHKKHPVMKDALDAARREVVKYADVVIDITTPSTAHIHTLNSRKFNCPIIKLEASSDKREIVSRTVCDTDWMTKERRLTVKAQTLMVCGGRRAQVTVDEVEAELRRLNARYRLGAVTTPCGASLFSTIEEAAKRVGLPLKAVASKPLSNQSELEGNDADQVFADASRTLQKADLLLAFRTRASDVTRRIIERAADRPCVASVVIVAGGRPHPDHPDGAPDTPWPRPLDLHPVGTRIDSWHGWEGVCVRLPPTVTRTVHDPTWLSLGRYRAVRFAKRHLGLEAMPKMLDAEFLDTDVSAPAPFKYTVIHTDQKGDRERGFYKVDSMLEIDTCIVSQEMWKMETSTLKGLAGRLKVPTKIDLPYQKLFDFSDAMRREEMKRRFPKPGDAPSRLNHKAAKDYASIARYCIFDSIVVLECEFRMGTILETLLNGWLSRTHPSGYFRRGVTWRCFTTLICRAFKTCVIIIRSDGFVGGYQGAFCLDPSRGFYEVEGTSSVDVNSLYPTAQQMANLCFSMLILDEKHLRRARELGLEIRYFEFHGKTFPIVQFVKGSRYAREGILPQMMCFLIGARKRVKKLMKAERNPEKRAVYDKQQQALKVAANGTYGALAFSGFKIPAKCLAAATTFVGREVVMEMKRAINEDFLLPRLQSLAPSICARAQVPRRFWRLNEAPRMRDLGGDTDSVFWMQPVPKGNTTDLVVLRWRWTRGEDDKKGKPTYSLEVEEVKEEEGGSGYNEEAKVAVQRFHKRRAKTRRQRQAAVDKRKKAFKAAQAAGVPVITRTIALTDATCSRRIRMILAEEVTDHMVKKCFNQREKLVGRQIMGIGVDYVMERLLLLKKKNYAGLIWESMDLIEDDDFYAKQAGMPSIKADTPKFIATTFGTLVKTLQLQGLNEAVEVVEAACRKIMGDEVPVAKYAKRVKISDPRNTEEPMKVAQLALYLRMKERGEKGTLGTVEIPDIGSQMHMVKTLPPVGKVVHPRFTWEHPDWIVQEGLKVDRNHYIQVLLKKMEYIGMPSLERLELRVRAFAMMAQHQDNLRLAGARGLGLNGMVGKRRIRTPTDDEVRKEMAYQRGEKERRRAGRTSKKHRVAAGRKNQEAARELVQLRARQAALSHQGCDGKSKQHKQSLSDFAAAARSTKTRRKTARKRKRGSGTVSRPQARLF